MPRRILSIFWGLFFSFLLSFNLGIKEYVHNFTGHQDTIDHIDVCSEHNGDSSFHFEQEHHHCDWLTDQLPPFLGADFFIAPPPNLILVFPEFVNSIGQEAEQTFALHYYLRGPPTLT